jgi:anti-anti-sigma factor
MPFDVERSALDSGVTVLALSGTMTMGNQLQELERAVEELTKNDRKKIVIDLSRVTYLDSSALGVLVGCHGTIRKSGGQLRLAGVSNRVVAIFQMTGIDGVLNVDSTRDRSVSALVSRS